MSVSVTLYLKFALLTMKECVPRSWSESASLVCNKDAYGEQKCTDIPAMDCKDVDKEKCWDEPREKSMTCQTWYAKMCPRRSAGMNQESLATTCPRWCAMMCPRRSVGTSPGKSAMTCQDRCA